MEPTLWYPPSLLPAGKLTDASCAVSGPARHGVLDRHVSSLVRGAGSRLVWVVTRGLARHVGPYFGNIVFVSKFE